MGTDGWVNAKAFADGAAEIENVDDELHSDRAFTGSAFVFGPYRLSIMFRADSRAQVLAAPTDRKADVMAGAMASVARHVSTPSGQREVESLLEKAQRHNDLAFAGFLASCMTVDLEMRRVYDAVDRDVASLSART